MDPKPLPTPILDYAPPDSQVWCIPWKAVGCPVILCAASIFTMLYCDVGEPFYNLHDLRGILILRVLPFILILCWLAWAPLVYWRTQPRIIAWIVLLIGIPVGVWSVGITLAANGDFEADQTYTAQWYQLPQEEPEGKVRE